MGMMQTVYGSHSAIAPFRLVRPATIDDAVAAAADGGVCHAGGVDLVPQMRAGRRVELLVHLGGIPALKLIENHRQLLRIGAGVTYAQLATDTRIAAALPDLARIWSDVANVRVRHAATIGGNLMAANAQYDMLPALMALDAQLVFAKRGGEQVRVAADVRPWPRGVLAAIEIPLSAERRFGFERGFKPVISFAIGIERKRARIAIGCAFATAQCQVFDLDGPADVVGERVVRALPDPLTDWIASSSYRRTLAHILLRRQLHKLITIGGDGRQY